MKKAPHNNYLTLLLMTCMALFSTTVFSQDAQLSKAQLDGWIESLSNWGRWGAEDEKGTLNLITPETRKAAATLVESGISVSMAHDTLVEEALDNFSPYEHEMSAVGGGRSPWAMDRFGVSFHGYAHSHLDAVCHRFHEGKMYNGFADTEVTSEGCNKLDITVAEDGIFGRGVLMDIPRLKGVDWLEPGTPIMPEDLLAWERESGVTLRSGDIVLIRTGRWARRAALGPWNVAEISAGLHASAVVLLHERDVALVGSDVAADVFPSQVEGYTHPVHVLLLIALGTPIFDNLDLEDVATEAANQNRWEFLFTAAPLRIPGGTGSPLNPIATF